MLRIEHLSKEYSKGKKAVDDLSLHVLPGQIHGFIGHNGAGKTTTLRSIAGILTFEEGEIFVGGNSVKSDPIAAKKITAFIPDNPDLYDFLSGIAYLNLIADLYSISKADREGRIQKYADMFELTSALGSPIASYSHGMKQKLALISAFVRSPKLLILDEPFVGLDPIASRTMKDLMAELCAEGGSVFFSTHVLEVAEKICTHISIIRGGRLVVSGSTQEVVKDSSLENVFLELADKA
jgi:ABC-type multidrug transport system, ATPase component